MNERDVLNYGIRHIKNEDVRFAKEKGQLKVDGTLMWHCPMKFAFDYYVVLNQDNQAIKSYTEEEFSESLVPDGFSFEKRSYGGCPKHQKRY